MQWIVKIVKIVNPTEWEWVKKGGIIFDEGQSACDNMEWATIYGPVEKKHTFL